mmetsp:Transcript_39832/g.99701  ORF Transcript_39832/g.99701 Transcript_39832/m.99701 type:complete len:219 (+) Transcript_39832:146-802(+)
MMASCEAKELLSRELEAEQHPSSQKGEVERVPSSVGELRNQINILFPCDNHAVELGACGMRSSPAAFASSTLTRSASGPQVNPELDPASIKEEQEEASVELSEVIHRKMDGHGAKQGHRHTGASSGPPPPCNPASPVGSPRGLSISTGMAEDWRLPASPQGLMNARRKHNFLMGLQNTNAEATSPLQEYTGEGEGRVSPLGSAAPTKFKLDSWSVLSS